MNTVFKSTAYLTASHIAGYLIPLLEIPILARALGPTAYGQVVLIQSIALLSSLIVEYGFNLSASREVAKATNDTSALGRIFADVTLARALVSIFVLLTLLLIAKQLVPASAEVSQAQVFFGFLYFLAFGFSPFWFFLGRESLAGVVALDLFLRLCGLTFLFCFVNEESDASLALGILASTSLANTLISNAWCMRQTGSIRFNLRSALHKLKDGFHVFLYRSSNTLLLTAAPSVIGISSDRTAIGIFVPAEKVIRGVVGLSTPLFTAVFPHFSRAFSTGNAGSHLAAWRLVIASVSLGAACAVLIYAFGPKLILLVIGEEFSGTADLLRWFAWLIPLRIASQAFGLVILIPSGRERLASYALIFFSLLTLILGFLLARINGALGMVQALLLAEAGLATTLLLLTIATTNILARHCNEK